MTEQTIRKIADVVYGIRPRMNIEEIRQAYNGDYILTTYRGKQYLIDHNDFRVKWIGKHQWGD